jgi:hypothetical protein
MVWMISHTDGRDPPCALSPLASATRHAAAGGADAANVIGFAALS